MPPPQVDRRDHLHVLHRIAKKPTSDPTLSLSDEVRKDRAAPAHIRPPVGWALPTDAGRRMCASTLGPASNDLLRPLDILELRIRRRSGFLESDPASIVLASSPRRLDRRPDGPTERDGPASREMRRIDVQRRLSNDPP